MTFLNATVKFYFFFNFLLGSKLNLTLNEEVAMALPWPWAWMGLWQVCVVGFCRFEWGITTRDAHEGEIKGGSTLVTTRHTHTCEPTAIERHLGALQEPSGAL